MSTPSSADPGPARVVLIEDHSMVRQLLAHVVVTDLALKLVGESTTVADARELLRREQPDLAIVDWMLPDGRGFDLVRTLAVELPRTRWLFVSSNERGHIVREAVSLGVHGFVMKRSDLFTLRDGIRRVLAGERYYCAESARLLVEKMIDEHGTVAISLTAREREVLRGFARGENPKALAERLGISTKTVQNQITLLKEKLNLHEPAELVHYAIRQGYIEAP